MGYYTDFSLKVVKPPLYKKGLIREFRESNENAAWAFDDSGACSQNGEQKWYTAVPDLVCFSQDYPEVVFVLTGQGEEKEDFWRAYVKGGEAKTVKGEISYPPSPFTPG